MLTVNLVHSYVFFVVEGYSYVFDSLITVVTVIRGVIDDVFTF